MKDYFEKLEKEAKRLYGIAAKARSQGLDPAFDPEIPLAKDLAGRVEGLVGPRGVAKRIRGLSERLPKEEVSLEVAREIVEGKFGSFPNIEAAAEQAIRTSLAILTEGIVAAPLEGIVKVKIKRNHDNTQYLAIYFAGPIRSAGGSAQALAVLTGDYVRHALGLDRYKPTNEEVERFVEETDLYNSEASRLQYFPSSKETRHAVRNIPVEITGEGTDRVEVSGYRNLERIETNQVRGGAILVLAEGVLQKAPKLLKYVEKFELPGWEWLGEHGKSKSADKKEGEIKPNPRYIKDLIAGRPVLSHPSTPGGLRLRYGRCRNSGFASVSLHPATMAVLDDFIAIGTQIKTERPGKGAAVTPCDSIEGPIVKLLDGSVLKIDKPRDVRRLKAQIKEVLYLGDVLVSYGDFLENNHPLMPAGYAEEWWIQELEKAAGDKEPYQDFIKGKIPSPKEAIMLSEDLGIPLHPRYTHFYSTLSKEKLKGLAQWLGSGKVHDGGLILDMAEEKAYLELLGVPHRVFKDKVIIEEHEPLLRVLGLHEGFGAFLRVYERVSSSLEVVNSFGIKVMEKAPTYIGARMGRPEKAKERKMQPAVNVLFPIGQNGGRTRDVKKAAQKDKITVEVARRWCPSCKEHFITTLCPRCGEPTELQRVCRSCGRPSEEKRCRSCGGLATFYHSQEIGIKKLLQEAADKVGDTPKELKGVIGMTSAYKIPEPLEKGLLRSRHGVYVFKDGTTRFDATDAPLTHFTPEEIGVKVQELRKLGYSRDYRGMPLKTPDQVLELKCQDVIIPEEAGEYLLRTSQFIDDLLAKFYGLEPYYGAKVRGDLVGHLIVGLAPHTSAAILGRIIGFTKAKTCYAHPYFHAAKRRNCLLPATEILVLNHGHAKLLSMEEIYRNADPAEAVVDDFGTKGRKVNLSTLAVDPVTGEFKTRRIKYVIRSPAPRHLINIITRSGRAITASPEHRFLVSSPQGLGFKKALEMVEGDSLLVPERITAPEEDLEGFDLLVELGKIGNLREELMVRDAGDAVKELIAELGGRKKASQGAGISQMTLANYLRRDSIPLGVLEKLLELCGKDFEAVPKRCFVGVKRNAIKIPRVIEVSPEFMRFFGYYLADGQAGFDEKQLHQLSLSSADGEVLADIRNCLEKTFGLTSRARGGVITISSRVVYHFLVDVLEVGRGAGEKRVPRLFLSLPLGKIRELLRAYFAEGGSVEKNRLHVTCSSVNARLLSDIGFLLHRFGIFWELRRGERKDATPPFYQYTITIRSTHAKKFCSEIGFANAKQKSLQNSLKKERTPRLKRRGSMVLDPVKKVTIIKCNADFLYDVEVEDYHNFLTGDFILSGNCDGDEDAFFLLLDGLVNFSKAYLPSSRGGKMDAPLVLTTTLDPKEVDDEAHNIDVVERYPLEFYKATLRYARPQEVKALIETVSDRIGKPEQYEGFRFTHPTSDISSGPRVSAYKTLGAMMEKVQHQLALARKIRAVDEGDVARRVVEGHFLPDLTGNLRAFSKQTIRCVSCNSKYRRIPLMGTCRRCGGKLVLTVSKGSVEKYLQITKGLIDSYDLDDYLRQRIQILEMSISSVFENEGVKQVSLSDFL
jgi:DNA polymerase II large subunit